MELLLAVLNSKLTDWYFRLGSTNASASHYQLYNLPAPAFAPGASRSGESVGRFEAALQKGDLTEALEVVDPFLASPPFPSAVKNCMIRVVEQIITIESARGEIARADRSALDPKAQPFQDLLDRMLFRMTGLSESEATALENRLETML